MRHHWAVHGAVVSEQLIKERIAQLSAKSLNELAALPAVSSEDIVHNGKKYLLSVWHDVLEAGVHQIVVQAYKHWFLSIGTMRAEGFRINSQNERRTLTDEELWPFT